MVLKREFFAGTGKGTTLQIYFQVSQETELF